MLKHKHMTVHFLMFCWKSICLIQKDFPKRFPSPDYNPYASMAGKRTIVLGEQIQFRSQLMNKAHHFSNHRQIFQIILKLVGGFKHGFFCPFHIWDVILPIDFHSIIFQDGEIAPPTSISLHISRSPTPTFRFLRGVNHQLFASGNSTCFPGEISERSKASLWRRPLRPRTVRCARCRTWRSDVLVH